MDLGDICSALATSLSRWAALQARCVTQVRTTSSGIYRNENIFLLEFIVWGLKTVTAKQERFILETNKTEFRSVDSKFHWKCIFNIKILKSSAVQFYISSKLTQVWYGMRRVNCKQWGWHHSDKIKRVALNSMQASFPVNPVFRAVWVLTTYLHLHSLCVSIKHYTHTVIVFIISVCSCKTRSD